MATYTSEAARSNMLATIAACDSKGVVKNFNPADTFAQFTAKIIAAEEFDPNTEITVSQVSGDTRIVIAGAASSPVLGAATGSDDLSTVLWNESSETIHVVSDLVNRVVPGQPGDMIPVPNMNLWIRALTTVA